MKEPNPQPRRRDAAVLIALLLVAGTIWLTVLGPMGGRTGWITLVAILGLLALTRVLQGPIQRFSRDVSGKGKRRRKPPGDAS